LWTLVTLENTLVRMVFVLDDRAITV